MVSTCANRVLWANIDLIQAMGQKFTRANRFQWTDWLGLLTLIAVVIAGGYALNRLLARQESNRPSNSPRALFRALCRAHALNHQQCQLLRQLARHFRLAHPALVFTDLKLYEPQRLNPTLRSQLAALHALRDRLFKPDAATAAPAPAVSAPPVAAVSHPTDARTKLSALLPPAPLIPPHVLQSGASTGKPGDERPR